MIFVSQDGDGDFNNIKDAILNAMDGDTVLVKKGIYKEKVLIKQRGINLIGENGTVLTYDDSAKKEVDGKVIGTFNSYTLLVLGEEFKCENFIFENSSGKGKNISQAIAVFVNSDKVSFKNCEFHSYQDTLCLGPIPYDCANTTPLGVIKDKESRVFRSYFENCYIKGDVDFIFGGGIAVFNSCQIHSIKRGKTAFGYITACSTHEDLEFGFNFFNCHFTANFNEPNIFLGRPWRPFAKVTLIECAYDNHICEEGFKSYGTDEYTYNFAEYNCKHNSDKNKRAPFVKELTKDEREKYTFENILGIDTNILW